MKKTIIKITVFTVFSFIGFSALAQNAADKKAKVDDTNKTTAQEKLPAPQLGTEGKALTAAEQPKPIVPGGEFKPVNTNVPLKNYAKNPAPQQASIPVKVLEQPALQKQQ